MADAKTPEQKKADDLAAAERIRLDNEYAAEQARVAEERRRSDAAVNEAAMKEPAPEPEPDTGAAGRLQAFEKEHLGMDGKEPVRINGQIERGVGSPFAKMSDAHRAQHAALENLVAAEANLTAANAALSKADADCQIAAKAVEAAEEKANAAAE